MVAGSLVYCGRILSTEDDKAEEGFLGQTHPVPESGHGSEANPFIVYQPLASPVLVISAVAGLVKTDAGDASHLAHLAHQLGYVDRGAGVLGADSEGAVVGNHLGEDVEDGLSGVSHSECFFGGNRGSVYLGDGLVVDVDQVARGRVDLEGLVKGKGALDDLGGCGRGYLVPISTLTSRGGGLTVCAQGLALLDLLQEVGLLLVGRGGEALILCVVDCLPHGLSLGLLLGSGLVLVYSRHAPLIAAQLSPEFGGGAAAVVKVDSIG